jgi:hypothetical protein
MYSNQVDSEPPQRRGQILRWAVRVLIALIISAIIFLLFFTTGAISH